MKYSIKIPIFIDIFIISILIIVNNRMYIVDFFSHVKIFSCEPFFFVKELINYKVDLFLKMLMLIAVVFGAFGWMLSAFLNFKNLYFSIFSVLFSLFHFSMIYIAFLFYDYSKPPFH